MKELRPITYTNIREFPATDFRAYLRADGYSHSFLRYEKDGTIEYKEVTEKMLLGSMVDSLLTEPDRVRLDAANQHLFPAACEIASQVKALYGPIIAQFRAQVNYVGVMHCAGLSMNTKGRLDWLLPCFAVSDLKVTTAKNEDAMRALIKYMGYDNQLWHYCKMAGVTRGYIHAYSTTAKRCLRPLFVDCSGDTNEFWEGKVIKFGTVAA